MKLRRRSLELLGDEPPKRERGRPIEPHRTEKVKADTELVRLKTAKLRGERVSAADVEREWANICADVRQRMLASPGRCAAQGVAREAVSILDTEIRAALRALAGVESDSDARRA